MCLLYYQQWGKQTTCAMPEVFGDGPLDVRMHREEEICTQTVKNSWDEKETQGKWKQAHQRHWVRCLHQFTTTALQADLCCYFLYASRFGSISSGSKANVKLKFPLSRCTKTVVWIELDTLINMFPIVIVVSQVIWMMRRTAKVSYKPEISHCEALYHPSIRESSDTAHTHSKTNSYLVQDRLATKFWFAFHS